MAKQKMTKQEQFHELSEDTIEVFKNIEKEYAFAFDIKYVFQGNAKSKKLIEIKKIPDNYSVLLKDTDVLVQINEDFFIKMDDDIIHILFEQELDKLETNMDKGTIKIVQHSIKANPGLFNKYESGGVLRANEIQKLMSEQKEDEESLN